MRPYKSISKERKNKKGFLYKHWGHFWENAEMGREALEKGKVELKLTHYICLDWGCKIIFSF